MTTPRDPSAGSRWHEIVFDSHARFVDEFAGEALKAARAAAPDQRAQAIQDTYRRYWKASRSFDPMGGNGTYTNCLPPCWGALVESLEKTRDKIITKTAAPQQAQSAPIVQFFKGDYVTGDKVLGNKTEQNGVKGSRNTVGGSISQNVGKQDTPKKSRLGRKIIEGVIVGVIVAIIAFFLKAGWQNLQSNKPPAEESLSSETPSVVTPEEELSNPVLRNNGENSPD
jgi:hypothetical protein